VSICPGRCAGRWRSGPPPHRLQAIRGPGDQNAGSIGPAHPQRHQLRRSRRAAQHQLHLQAVAALLHRLAAMALVVCGRLPRHRWRQALVGEGALDGVEAAQGHIPPLDGRVPDAAARVARRASAPAGCASSRANSRLRRRRRGRAARARPGRDGARDRAPRAGASLLGAVACRSIAAGSMVGAADRRDGWLLGGRRQGRNQVVGSIDSEGGAWADARGAGALSSLSTACLGAPLG